MLPRFLANSQERHFNFCQGDIKQHFSVVLICFPLIIDEVECLFMYTSRVFCEKPVYNICPLFFLWLVAFPYSCMVFYVLRALIVLVISCWVTQLVTLAQNFSRDCSQNVGPSHSHLRLWGFRVPSKIISIVAGRPVSCRECLFTGMLPAWPLAAPSERSERRKLQTEAAVLYQPDLRRDIPVLTQ